MTARLRSCWQKIKQHPFIVMGIVVALFAIIAFLLAVHVFGWDWTGFTGGYSKITTTSTPNGTTTAKELQPGKTLWDWLGLLAALAIPLVVGLGAAWFTAQQGKVSDRENTDNQRETALQAYIDKISELLLKEHLGELTADGKSKPEYEQVRKIARVRTITILFQLDARRIGYVFAFLREVGLMSAKSDESIVSFRGADLDKINLSQTFLREANLSRANLGEANLSGANLIEANLSGANLSKADLSGAILWEANLIEADLGEADLSGAILSGVNLSKAILSGVNLSRAILSEADLSRAILSEANLSEANLSEANLSRANLSRANLSGVNNFSTEQLEKAKSLQGAIMPDGSKHP